MAKTSEGSRLAYADLLRVFSMLAVVALHVSAGWINRAPVGSADWNAANIWDSLTRWCVPVYVMLSGMFLLDPKKSLAWAGLLRHIFRVAVSLAVWGFFYETYPILLREGFSLSSLRLGLLSLLRGTNQYHLWFLYMILGLYLLTPLLRAFVRGASRADFHWLFLLVFLFVFTCPFLLKLYPSQTAAFYLNKLYLNFNLLFPPLAYVGYYLAGYYLKTYALSHLAGALLYLCGVLGGIATVWGTAYQSAQAGEPALLFYSYFAPNVCFTAVAVFVLFRYLLGMSEERSRRQHVGRMAEISFGVYLIHPFFLALLGRYGLDTPSCGALLGIPLVVLAVFLSSLVLSWLLHKLPVVGRYIT